MDLTIARVQNAKAQHYHELLISRELLITKCVNMIDLTSKNLERVHNGYILIRVIYAP